MSRIQLAGDPDKPTELVLPRERRGPAVLVHLRRREGAAVLRALIDGV